ncbi:MAG: anthranilate synthase component I family protein [Deferribacteraceae bacterium]|jgi:anthranilate synthase component 1|nr:anthranilate synthase component I family protein [Deferribacteraceae bacterium]
MIRPKLDEARQLSVGHTLIPIYTELYSDIKTPVDLLRVLKSRGEETYILESAPGGEQWGRYTFLGYSPLLEIVGNNGAVEIRQNGSTELKHGGQTALKELLKSYSSPRIDYMPPFTGGFVGYFSYEYFRRVEPTLNLTENDSVGFDDFRLMLFDKVLAYDNFRQKLFLIVNIRTDRLEENYISGAATLKDMEALFLATSPELMQRHSHLNFQPDFTKEKFCEGVQKAKKHIYEGDIFQCVPSVRFCSEYGDDLLPAYRVLRTTNPSAYMFYLKFRDLQLAGASPETLISLKNGVVSTYPLAGTCKRLPLESDTDALIEKLLKDEKELAEHDMLVDLGRNDIGKVCKFGSVKVEEYRSIKKLSHVCHIASRVAGILKEGYSALDVLDAAIPAGTLSGAPKKRACEIIDEIEGSKRGVYGGAVGYIDFAGNMDFCIGIRMALLKDRKVYVQAGAGIVYDSVPEREYEECLSKAEAMMNALRTADGEERL